VTAFGFNENDAKRIGKVVRLAERNPSKPDLGQPDYGGRSPGVRLLIAKHSGSSWASGSTAVVTVYNGPPGGVASAVTVVAYNHYVQFGSDTNCTNRWVALGHNGFGWIAIDSQSDCGTCVSAVGGVDFRVFPGYSRTTEQVLGHDTSGCIKWFDTTTCATAAE
jgi:hypothetical protein